MDVLDQNALPHLEVEVVWNGYVVSLEMLGTATTKHLLEVVRLVTIELHNYAEKHRTVSVSTETLYNIKATVVRII